MGNQYRKHPGSNFRKQPFLISLQWGTNTGNNLFYEDLQVLLGPWLRGGWTFPPGPEEGCWEQPKRLANNYYSEVAKKQLF